MKKKKIIDILNKYVFESLHIGRHVILADRIDEIAKDICKQQKGTPVCKKCQGKGRYIEWEFGQFIVCGCQHKNNV